MSLVFSGFSKMDYLQLVIVIGIIKVRNYKDLATLLALITPTLNGVIFRENFAKRTGVIFLSMNV